MRVLTLVAVCLAAGTVGLAMRTDAQGGAETACEAEAEAVREDYLSRRFEGPTAREDLLEDVRSFQARHADAPICRQITRDYEVVLLLLNRRIGDADSVLTETMADPTFERLPAESQSRLLYNKGYATVQLGRIGDSAQYYYRAASLADQLPAHLGVRSYSYAATTARELNDLPTAELFLEAAERILRDSSRALTSTPLAASAFYVERASSSLVKAERAYDQAARRSAYRAMQADADSAYQLLQGATQDDEVGQRVVALTYRARADMLLGELDAAERSLALAWPHIAQGETVFQHIRHTWWRNRTRLDIATGDLDRALASSLQTEAEARALGTAAVLKLYNSIRRTGTVYERMGRLGEAESAYRQAIALTEVERERIGLRDWTASSFVEQQRPHRALARLLIDSGRTWEAFEVIDATRARTFRDLQAATEAKQNLAPADYETVDALADSLAAVRVELATSPDASTQSALTTTIVAYQDSIQSYLGVQPTTPDSLVLAELQNALRADQRVLLSYLLYDEKGFAFVVRPDTLVVVPIPTPSDSIRARSDRMIEGWTRDAPDPAFQRQLAVQLYEDLIAPVEAWVPEDAPLTILPDAAFAQLPLSALIDPSTSDYLVRQHALTTELATGLMLDAFSTSPARGLDVLAMGRSAFGSDGIADLPFVPAEIQSVQSHAARSRSALDEGATERAFKETAPSARVVHIASHAFVDPAIPFNSRILLSASSAGGDDGTLYLHELQNANLDADLVVLSGCSTAQGQQHDGEGMIGLQYGVRVAGARAALATLWPVDDRATVELMDAFYAGLANGLSKDRALQQAQLAYLDASDARTASPFFWAGAVLSGDPSPVPLGGSRPPWVLWLGLAALLGALGLAWRLRSQMLPA